MRVEWSLDRVDEQERLAIHWVETGVKLKDERPRQCFGKDLIERTLAHGLGGEASLEFGSDGLHCTISVLSDEEILLEKTPAA